MDLIELLPSHLSENTKMVNLQSILTNDINALSEDIDETIDQCFVSTATSVLSRYENLYGIEVDVSKSDIFRKERIKAKIRGVGTATKMMIADTVKAYSNGEVEVIENPENNSFKIKFVGTIGVPHNMADITLTIEEIKPAHLSYTFEYVYNANSRLSLFTHSHLASYTQYQLRNEVLS